MKNKIILALLCVTLFCQSVTVFAENTEYDDMDEIAEHMSELGI